jgi:cytosine permease
MALSSPARDESTEGFAHSPVPMEETGSARKIFFIVVGTLCGLPGFVLASNIAASFGIRAASRVFLVGGAVSAALGAFSAFTGARTRMSLALLAEATFGKRGANVVQLTIAVSAIGWFAVIVSVLGAVTSNTIAGVYGVRIPTPAIALPLCALVALIAGRGVNSLQKLGTLIVPTTFILLVVSVILTLHSGAAAPARTAGMTLDFSSAVAAVVGSYIVGIIIQPDYARFVRQPSRAALAEIAALGAAYPGILFLAALPAVALGKPDLIAALITLGLGIPALVLLLLGAWIDASSCLYSGSLALAVLFPKLRLTRIVIGASVGSALLALGHADRHFLSFLQVLGMSLPPLAAVQCTTALLTSRERSSARSLAPTSRIKGAAFLSWAFGIAVGAISQHPGWSLTGISVVDSVTGSVVATLVLPGVATHSSSFAGSSKVPAAISTKLRSSRMIRLLASAIARLSRASGSARRRAR